MLNSSHRPQAETVSRLVDVWAARYRPDFSVLEAGARSLIVGEIYQLLQAPGFNVISEKLNQQKVINACKLAAVRTKDFYVGFEDLDLKEITTLAQLSSCIYLQLLEFYQSHLAVLTVSEWELEHFPLERLGQLFKTPNISDLASLLRPLIDEFQIQNSRSEDETTLGFMTTQISLTNALLFQELDLVEQALVGPYFRFLEEHMALPWQRLCAAAASHRAGGPVFRLVERMLPMMSTISLAVHTQWSQDFPYHYTRRGRLNSPEVRHSSLRDFNMFQVYLWLSFLQGHSKVIENELVIICRLVYGQMGIPWEMTVHGTRLLIDRVLSYLKPYELSLVTSCTSDILKAFTQSEIVSGELKLLQLRYP